MVKHALLLLSYSKLIFNQVFEHYYYLVWHACKVLQVRFIQCLVYHLQ
jgi:hypothetical protein